MLTSADIRYPDRREGTRSSADFWQQLSGQQQASLYHLGKFGFQLLFVRGSQRGMAVAVCGDDYATICQKGLIDMAPTIQFRE